MATLGRGAVVEPWICVCSGLLLLWVDIYIGSAKEGTIDETGTKRRSVNSETLWAKTQLSVLYIFDDTKRSLHFLSYGEASCLTNDARYIGKSLFS
jgi:hypothetical protein